MEGLLYVSFQLPLRGRMRFIRGGRPCALEIDVPVYYASSLSNARTAV